MLPGEKKCSGEQKKCSPEHFAEHFCSAKMSSVSPSGCDDASSVTSSLGVATPASEMRCAASILCRAHDGADLACSPHHCSQREKRMHSAFLCGETVEDYIASGKSINIDIAMYEIGDYVAISVLLTANWKQSLPHRSHLKSQWSHLKSQ